jgi:uncharacterized protein YbjQ (UPF0145 family)
MATSINQPSEEDQELAKKVGSHRRVVLEDVKKYKLVLQESRRKTLEELAKETQDMGLGY